MEIILIAIVLILAAANGANDNVKGAVTLLGSGVMGYRSSITLATLATAAGGVVSIFLANGLLQAFSGKGIVPAAMTTSIPFLLSVAMGAALTVWIATLVGLPISTTHALLGGILGAGLTGAASEVSWPTVAKLMLLPLLLPLLLSPLIALLLSAGLALLLRWIQGKNRTAPVASVSMLGAEAVINAAASNKTGAVNALKQTASALWMDRAHLLTASSVSFARGLNDTPKIAALLAATGSISVVSGTSWVVIAMAIGGALAAHKVANTMAFKVTKMDATEGFGSNLVTALLVIVASRFGLPVSTTHVSTGSLFGVAITNGTGSVSVIRNILLAWCFTLPLACLFAAITSLLIGWLAK
jgi:inorganic phosphate transporter, PiT family